MKLNQHRHQLWLDLIALYQLNDPIRNFNTFCRPITNTLKNDSVPRCANTKSCEVIETKMVFVLQIISHLDTRDKTRVGTGS